MIIAERAVVSFSSSADPISGGPGSSFLSPKIFVKRILFAPYTTDVAGFGGLSHVRSWLLPGRDNGRFAYSVCVVHFRKVRICQKIGSAGNGHPVI
jgi:hypothetical protein